MKVLALALGAVAAMSAAAAAQEVSTPRSGQGWSGFYVGGHAGYAWGQGAPDPSGSEWFDGESGHEGDSFMGGLQIGYNHQISNFVLSIEADLTLADLRSRYFASYDESIYADPNYEYHLEEELSASSRIEWFGTVRPRVGILPNERLMIYGTGGLAYGKVKTSSEYSWREHGFWWGGPGDHFFDRSGNDEASSSKVRTGWTTGGGAEYALTDDLSLKGEYLFIDLGRDDARFSTVRLGLNLGF